MSNKIKYVGQIKGIPLIKLQSCEIIEKIQAGSLRLNSLKFYREFYNKTLDKVIGDSNEGKFIIHEATIKIPDKGINESIKDTAFPTANENDFVFCSFGIGSYTNAFTFNEEQKQKLSISYDSALLITDFSEFKKRIQEAARSRGIEIKDGFVKYYDQSIDDVFRLLSLLQNGMQNIVFHKTNDYRYQQEYRFTSQNVTGEDFLDLDIGDISEISKKFTIKEIFNLLITSVK